MNYTPYMMNPMNYTPYQQLANQQIANQQMMAQQMYGQQFGMSQPQQIQPQQTQIRQDFIGAFVNSSEEIKSFPIPIGSSVLLLDRANGKFYIKVLDSNNNPVMSTFKFEEYIETPKVTSNTTDEIESKYTEEINKLKLENKQLKESLDKIYISIDGRIKQLETKGGNIK